MSRFIITEQHQGGVTQKCVLCGADDYMGRLVHKDGCLYMAIRDDVLARELQPIVTAKIAEHVPVLLRGIQDGFEQGEDFSHGETHDSSHLNETYDSGVNAGIAMRKMHEAHA